MTKAILVTGTPAVGKTTVSHMLASKLNALYVGVTELVKEQQLITEVDETRQTLVADTEKTTKQIQQILTNTEGIVIIEGHYATDVVPTEYIDKIFVLRRDPQQLKNTLEQRNYPEKKVWENVAAEVLDICLLDALSACETDKICEIDVSDKTVDNVVDEMLLVLQNKKACRVGIVDWLAKLENDGLLDEFMKHF